MLPSHSIRSFTTLTIVLICACSDSLAPSELGEEYLLVSVANNALPTTLYTTEHGSLRVLSQSIRFGPKGTGSITETTELVPLAADQPSSEPRQTTFGIQWTESEGVVEIEFACLPNSDCVVGPHLIARVDGHSLRATWGRQVSGREPLRYEEVVAAQ